MSASGNAREVRERAPNECLAGVSADGFLEIENHYCCGHCGHKTKLPLFALGERAARWGRSGPEEPELDDEDIPYFARIIDRHLAGGPSRMSIELECRCGRPAAMVIEVVAGGFVERFRPLVVVERQR